MCSKLQGLQTRVLENSQPFHGIGIWWMEVVRIMVCIGAPKPVLLSFSAFRGILLAVSHWKRQGLKGHKRMSEGQDQQIVRVAVRLVPELFLYYSVCI